MAQLTHVIEYLSGFQRVIAVSGQMQRQFFFPAGLSDQIGGRQRVGGTVKYDAARL